MRDEARERADEDEDNRDWDVDYGNIEYNEGVERDI